MLSTEESIHVDMVAAPDETWRDTGHKALCPVSVFCRVFLKPTYIHLKSQKSNCRDWYITLGCGLFVLL